jgi:hypothetical protein
MKKTLLSLCIVGSIFYNCQKKSSETSQVNTQVAIDSSFGIDSVFYDKLADSSLKSVERTLFEQWRAVYVPDTNFPEIDSSFSDFLKIDLLKSKNAFQKYTDSLDLGMLANSEAKIIDTLQLSQNSQLIRWAINSSSYQACPWYVYSSVFGTVLKSGKVTKTHCIGFDQHFGDPPAGYNQTVYTSYKNGTLSFNKVEETIDYDSEKEVVNKKEFAWKASIAL